MIATYLTRLQRHATRGAVFLAIAVTCCTPLAMPPAGPTAFAQPPLSVDNAVLGNAGPARNVQASIRPATMMRLPPTPFPVGASSTTGQPLQRALDTPTAGNPRPTATPLPLGVFWDRLRALQFAPVLEHLQVLPADQRDDSFFAINDALVSDDTTAPILRGVGASMDRLEVRWDVLEPAPGDFQFAQLDALMQSAAQLQFSVLAVVDGTPDWAASTPAGSAASPPQGLDQPALMADGIPNAANHWAVFLAAVSQRYAGRIAAWEIWNEPNSPEFWLGMPQQYARLYDVAQTVLSRNTPATPVLIGGQVSDDGTFLRAVAAALCPNRTCSPGELHDVAWHVYDNPTDIPRLAALTRSLLQPYGLRPDLWVTEANVPVNDPESPADAVTGPDAVSLDQQAAFVLQATVVARAAGVRSLAFYRASDVDDLGHYWGLLRGDMTARPALLAYRTAAQWLSHARLLQLSHPQPEVTLAQFCRSGSLVTVAWNSGVLATSTSLVVAATQASLVDVTGALTPISPANGVVTLDLPGASAPTAQTVSLGQPRLLIVASGCTASAPSE